MTAQNPWRYLAAAERVDDLPTGMVAAMAAAEEKAVEEERRNGAVTTTTCSAK